MTRTALIGIAAVLAGCGGDAAWPPSSNDPQKVAAAIAGHVAPRYLLSKEDGPLVAVTAETPHVVKAGRTFAVKQVGITRKNGMIVAVNDAKHQQDYTLCGAGPHCAIAPGKATRTRFRLVCREALELAYDTFAYSPSVDAVVVHAPPAPGRSRGDVFYFRRPDLLAHPRSEALPRDPPPLPNDADAREAATIDELTLPRFYYWSASGLPGGGMALVLSP